MSWCSSQNVSTSAGFHHFALHPEARWKRKSRKMLIRVRANCSAYLEAYKLSMVVSDHSARMCINYHTYWTCLKNNRLSNVDISSLWDHHGISWIYGNIIGWYPERNKYIMGSSMESMDDFPYPPEIPSLIMEYHGCSHRSMIFLVIFLVINGNIRWSQWFWESTLLDPSNRPRHFASFHFSTAAESKSLSSSRR